MTVWMDEIAKNHISKHSKMYSSFQVDIGSKASKRAFVTHPNAVTTAVKITLKTVDCDGTERQEKLKEDLETSVTLCFHNSFYRNRETNVDLLACCKQRVDQQRC